MCAGPPLHPQANSELIKARSIRDPSIKQLSGLMGDPPRPGRSRRRCAFRRRPTAGSCQCGGTDAGSACAAACPLGPDTAASQVLISLNNGSLELASERPMVASSASWAILTRTVPGIYSGTIRRAGRILSGILITRLWWVGRTCRLCRYRGHQLALALISTTQLNTGHNLPNTGSSWHVADIGSFNDDPLGTSSGTTTTVRT